MNNISEQEMLAIYRSANSPLTVFKGYWSDRLMTVVTAQPMVFVSLLLSRGKKYANQLLMVQYFLSLAVVDGLVVKGYESAINLLLGSPHELLPSNLDYVISQIGHLYSEEAFSRFEQTTL